MLFRTILILLFAAQTAIAQTGTITGTIIEKETGLGLPGVRVEVLTQAGLGATTDFDGKFTVKNIKPGKHTFRFSALTYQSVTMNNVNVAAGNNTPVSFQMEAARGGITEVVIEGTRNINTIASVNKDKIESEKTFDGITGSQMQAAGDNHLGEAARRVPGVTVIDNRFVMVRGLSERYNAVLLNNVFTPSVESDVKTFSFDMIPTGLIDRMDIYKAPSPDLPGEFAGGAVRLFTKIIPDNTSIGVGYSSSFRTGTTGNDFLMQQSSATDWLGFDNGLRNLPSGFPANVRELTSNTEIQSASQSFTNPWSYTTINAIPDQRFNLIFTGRISKAENADKGSNGFQFGNITAINYSNTMMQMESNRLDYNEYDTLLQRSDTVFHYTDQIFSRTARAGILQNNAIRFGKDGRHKIELKNIFNQIGTSENTFRGGANLEEGNYRREYSFRYMQRNIYSGQLTGAHELNNKQTNIDWTLGYSAANRNDPDWRRARYTKPFGATDSDPWDLYVPFQAQPFFLGRLFMSMQEDVKAGTINAEHKFRFVDKSVKPDDGDTAVVKYHFTVRGGMYYENKDRNFSVRNIGYAIGNTFNFNWNITHLPIDSVFMEQNIDTLTGLKIDEDTKKADQYVASNRLRAYYLMGTFPLLKDHLTISGGARIEHNVQRLDSYKTNGNTPVNVNNDILSVLPSVNATYRLALKNDSASEVKKDRVMLVRLGYGRTLNRPEFREIAPFYFYDFNFNSINTGNDSLKTPTIDNLDLRWEYYPTMNENISFGLFYKKFTNPIEMYFVPGVGSGGTRSFTWGNAPEAVSYGLELDIRKSLVNLFGKTWFDNFSVSANAAYIKSRVLLTNSTSNTGIDNERPMMGQSPYIVNGGMHYRNDSARIEISVLYNVIGPRIVIVGIPGVPEVYEMPRHQLDFTVTKKIGKYLDVKVGCQDLLNREFLLLQDANNDGKLDRATDQRMQYYKRGSYYTVGITVKVPDLKRRDKDKE